MADKTVRMDGALTIDETKSLCEVEQNKGFQLQNIQHATISQGGEALQINKAEFVLELNRLKTLLFFEPNGNDPEAIKTQKKKEGWKFLCSGPIFVRNNITNVMVFAK